MDAAAVSLPTVPSLSAAATASAATVRSKHEPNGRGVTSQSHGFYTYTTGAVDSGTTQPHEHVLRGAPTSHNRLPRNRAAFRIKISARQAVCPYREPHRPKLPVWTDPAPTPGTTRHRQRRPWGTTGSGPGSRSAPRRGGRRTPGGYTPVRRAGAPRGGGRAWTVAMIWRCVHPPAPSHSARGEGPVPCGSVEAGGRDGGVLWAWISTGGETGWCRGGRGSRHRRCSLSITRRFWLGAHRVPRSVRSPG
jgi:hypothetical protein